MSTERSKFSSKKIIKDICITVNQGLRHAGINVKKQDKFALVSLAGIMLFIMVLRQDALTAERSGSEIVLSTNNGLAK